MVINTKYASMSLTIFIIKNVRVFGFGVFFSACFLSLCSYGQQTFSYTQYMNNLTPINPASSLMDNEGSLNLLARKQWVGIAGAPTTLFFNGNIPIENTKASIGGIVENDQFAVENLTEINVYFAQSVRIGDEQFLSASLNAGFRNYATSYAQLDPTDPVLRDDVRENKPNAGFGVMYYSKFYYLGVSVPELTIRNLGQGSLLDNNYFRNNYFFTAGATLKVSDGIQIKPSALLSYTRGVPFVADISSTLVLKRVLGIGLNYRTDNEVALIVTTNFPNFNIGYSYQFGATATTLAGYSNATQEITLSYRFGKPGENVFNTDNKNK